MTKSCGTAGAGRSVRDWLPVLSVLSGLAAWELLSRLGALPPYLFPAPSAVARALAAGLASGAMLPHVLTTLRHLAAGFSLGALAGFGLALACGRWQVLDRLVDPWINATLPLPQIALLPLFMLLLGVGEGLSTAVSAFGSFYSVFVSLRSGILKADPGLADAARNLGAGRLAVLREVTLPSALPYLLVGMHLGLLQALRLVIIVEAMLSLKGVGHMLWLNGEWLRIEMYYAYLAVLALIGVGIVAVFRLAARKFAPWADCGPAGIIQ